MSKPARRGSLGLDALTDQFHRELLIEALRQTTTLAQTARQLNISLRRLHYMMTRLAIRRTVTIKRTVRIEIGNS